MNIDELRTRYDQEQRRNVQFPDTIRDDVGNIVRHTLQGERKHGWIVWSKLDEHTADRAIQAQIDHFKNLDAAIDWQVYDYDTPSNLKARLIAHDFTPREPDDSIMILDTHNIPEILSQPIPASIQRLTSPDEIPAAMQVLRKVWGEDMSALEQDLSNQLRNTPDLVSVYAAKIDDTYISMAWTMYSPIPDSSFAGLWGGSTLEAYRNQGLYTGLLAIRAKEAPKRGVRFLTVDASPMSRPILEKFGFVCIATSTGCIWTNDPTPES